MKKFKITDKIHIFPMEATWFYIPIPKEKIPNVPKKGWGSIPINAKIGKTKWRTSIFPIKRDNYFIPIKKLVRKNENLYQDDIVTIYYEHAI